MLTPRYAKDPEEEDFLERLNQALEGVERTAYRDVSDSRPLAFVVGVPRTGTTLLLQVLCCALDVGYINHLSASFWRAPVLGIRLSRKLLGETRPSSFTSQFGRTEGIGEPHEFGYFWAERLGYVEPVEKAPEEAEEIDWNSLRRTLLNMSDAFDKVAIYKAFHLGWHMQRMATLLPQSLFVWIRRTPLDTALSLLRLRREFVGSVSEWASFRPRDYGRWLGASPARQVAAQIHGLESSLAMQAARVPESQRVVLAYSDLCRDPGEVVETVADALERLGERPARVGTPPRFDVREPAGGQEAAEFAEALCEWYDDPRVITPWTELIKRDAGS